ncbi:MAG: anthranilate phosphoribosyltransferase [Isosphaeraceae bacterium]
MAVDLPRSLLHELDAGDSLSAELCELALGQILDGWASKESAKAFLTALHRKGETSEELWGAVLAIRERMLPFDVGASGADLLDTCGTGGDGAHTVNVSTATAIVVAACGVRVVKHGNRAASGSSGSSDVLDQLGVAIDVDLETLKRCLDELGIVFLFAPRFHPGLQKVAAIRRQLPFRTIFNLVGPLCNPASPTHQLVGVPGQPQAQRMAEALARGGALRRALVVTGLDGLDEVTLDGPTRVLVVEPGSIHDHTWKPDDFGLPRVPAAELKVSGPEESASGLRQMLQGKDGPVRRIVLANAAAALWALAPGSLPERVDRAARAIDSGAAARLVERWSLMTRGQP